MSQIALRSVHTDPSFVRLKQLQTRLEAREVELTECKTDLQALQNRYLREVGAHYRELSALEAHIVQIEIRAGLRAPEDLGDSYLGESDTADAPEADGAETEAPDALKQMFRDVAKAIHPDLALDEDARCRRHSLMAE